MISLPFLAPPEGGEEEIDQERFVRIKNKLIITYNCVYYLYRMKLLSTTNWVYFFAIVSFPRRCSTSLAKPRTTTMTCVDFVISAKYEFNFFAFY